MRPEDNNVTAASSMTGSATGPQTEEHRKTGRAGYLVLGWSVVFMAITVLSFALDYNSAIWWTTAGICVALFVVGILLVLESERQRQRRDKRGQPPSMARRKFANFWRSRRS
jgi:predicted membrane channel-forming protein YqfA (hemolysin III family)